jgi:3-phenylpropionate/trans-cinnamate dioxygenase ferredoxin reductase subunit
VNGDERADVLLVGGGVASARCARTLRRHGLDGTIVLVTDEPVPPYNRPPLSKEALRDDVADDLVLAEPDSWYDRRSIDVRRGERVVGLDPAARRADLASGRSVHYDRCLLATGAAPRSVPVPGGEHALLLRTLADARRLRRAALDAGPGAPVTVIGGGFIGVEVASSLAALGLRPTIVEVQEGLWGGALGSTLGSWAAETLNEAGVVVRLGASVSRLEPDAGWIGDERLEHAFAIAGVGVAPRVELGAAAGLAVGDGILTDEQHRTSAEGIWAAGDVARVAGRRVEHWHAAREGGERAAQSMLDEPLGPPPAPWFFSEVGSHPIDVFGLAETWEEERWLRPGTVLALIEAGRVVQLASIGSALDPADARAIVAERLWLDAAEDRIGGG